MWLRRPSRTQRELHLRREPVLGTALTLYAAARRQGVLDAVEGHLLAEIDRLEAIFSVFRPNSELRRWQATDGDCVVSGELAALLASALQWQQRSNGIFNPAVGVLTARWKQAEADETVPLADELATLAESIACPSYEIVNGQPHKTGDCALLNFNAFAKGHIVDLAAASLVQKFPVTTVLLNIGGDLVHIGERGAAVAIEDPLRPFDNAEPLMSIELRNAGFATSGSARRGFTVGGTWFSHVIDPHNGYPVDAIASASVLAGTAATADAIATVLSVVGPAEGMAFIDGIDDTAGLVVTRTGEQHRSARWLN
jgi:FAD:protein FMN transferase